MRSTYDEIPVELELGELVTRGTDLGGIYTRHIQLPAGTDFRPLLAGLPNDHCQCPHWGQVLSGSITIQYEDGTQEVCHAGDLYYWPAGHVGWTVDGVEFTELSRTDEITPVLEHIGKQLAPA